MQNKLKWLTILVMPFLLTGCWDSVEINKRNVVLEVAIDKNMKANTEQPINQRDSYQITYTIPDMSKLSGEDSLAKNVKSSIVTKSPTVGMSIDEVESKSQNTITFSHTQAIVLGEEILKDPELFRGTVDGLMRNMQIGRNTNILAVKGEAGTLTKEENPQNPILGLYLMKYFKNTERPISYAKEQVIGNLIKELQDSKITTIPVISSDENKDIQLSGAALIKDYKLVDWLEKDVVRGQLFVEGKINQVPIVVDYKGYPLTYVIEKERAKVTFNINKADIINTQGITGNIEILTIGNITEYISTNTQNIFSEQDIEEVTKLLQEEIRHQVMVTVNKSKEINTDFLNIGLEMYRKHPQIWKSYKSIWDTQGFKDFPLQVQVTSTIKNTGILQ